MEISVDKIKSRKSLYDLDLLEFKSHFEKKEKVIELFCEDLETKIANNKFFLNEFVFVFDKVKAKPQVCTYGTFKNEFYVKNL